jgi:adhesin transport system outer membrane protein
MNKKLSFFIGSIILIICTSINAQTLKQAVAQTIRTNPDVLIKLKGWLAAQEGIHQAQGGYFPTIDFNGDLGTEHINTPIEPNDHDLKPAGIGFSLREMIFDGFATPYEVQRNIKLTLAEQYTVEGTSNDVALLATKAYLDVIRNQKIVNLAQLNYQTHKKIYSMIKQRSERGLGREADTNQAFGRLSKAKANLLAAINNCHDALAIYYRIVGMMPENLQIPDSPKASVLPATKNIAIQEAIDNHPILKAAKADIEEAQAQHRASLSAYFPRLDAVLSTSNGNDINGYQGHYHDYRAALELKYNLFHGGSDLAYLQKTGFLVEQAEQIHNHTYNQVEENMKLAWNALQTSQEQLVYLKNHQDASISTTKAYYNQFTIGKRTLLDLLNSEDETFTAKIDYLDGQFDLLLSMFRVLNANGKLLSYLHIPIPTQQLEH